MTFTAYVDESEPSRGGTYVLSCALVAGDAADEVRTALASEKRPAEKKVHWHDRLPAQPPALVDLVAGLPSMHLLVVRDDCEDEPSERRRRKCMEHLFWLLDAHCQVPSVVMEARQAKQNAGDMQLLAAMRSSKRISTRLRLDHLAGPKEALLWVPDIVAGAFNAGRAGQPQLFAPLPLVEVDYIVP